LFFPFRLLVGFHDHKKDLILMHQWLQSRYEGKLCHSLLCTQLQRLLSTLSRLCQILWNQPMAQKTLQY
ncbi:hypothetical protein C3D81_21485, partial [Cronobacter sakazakii]